MKFLENGIQGQDTKYQRTFEVTNVRHAIDVVIADLFNARALHGLRRVRLGV